MCSKWLEKNWNAKPGISVQSLYMKLKKQTDITSKAASLKTMTEYLHTDIISWCAKEELCQMPVEWPDFENKLVSNCKEY